METLLDKVRALGRTNAVRAARIAESPLAPKTKTTLNADAVKVWFQPGRGVPHRWQAAVLERSGDVTVTNPDQAA